MTASLQQLKEDYLNTWHIVAKAARRVPEALTTLPDDILGANLYCDCWYVKDHFQQFRIDIPWRLDVLKALMKALEGNWQRRMHSIMGVGETQAGYGLNEDSGDYYLEFQYRDTDISLTVCLGTDESPTVVRYGKDMYFAPDDIRATDLFVEKLYCQLDAAWVKWKAFRGWLPNHTKVEWLGTAIAAKDSMPLYSERKTWNAAKERYFGIKENGPKIIGDAMWPKELDVPLAWRLELFARFLMRYISELFKVLGAVWGYAAYRIRKVTGHGKNKT